MVIPVRGLPSYCHYHPRQTMSNLIISFENYIQITAEGTERLGTRVLVSQDPLFHKGKKEREEKERDRRK